MPSVVIVAVSGPLSGAELPARTLVPLVLVLVLRGALAALFLGAGFQKLRRRARFLRIVRRYRLLPDAAVRIVAHVIIVAELAVGSALLAGVGIVGAFAAASVLLVGFAGAVTVNLARGRSFDCGCSMLERASPISWRHVLRNLALAGLAAIGVVASPVAATSIIPSFGLLAVGAAAPALILAERRVRALTPYPLGRTLRHFSALHPAISPPHEPEGTAMEVR